MSGREEAAGPRTSNEILTDQLTSFLESHPETRRVEIPWDPLTLNESEGEKRKFNVLFALSNCKHNKNAFQ